MKSNVIPLPVEPAPVRAARAAVAALPQAKRAALMKARHALLTLGMWAQGMGAEQGQVVRELADALDAALCTLMGFKGFSLRDIPPE